MCVSVHRSLARQPTGDSFEFSFNGSPVRAFDGDSIASALARAGVSVFSRSLKFHRPRGLFCGSGMCNSCVMNVDGVPGVRTCSTLARPGMVVLGERGLPSTQRDLLSIFDHIFRKELDYHHRFIRPAFMAPIYQRLIRSLSSSARLPDVPPSYLPLKRIERDVLIIGRGISGSVAEGQLRKLGVRSTVVDRKSSPGSGTAFGVYENVEVGVQTGDGIQLITPRTLLIATGRIETSFPLVNGDLPGNMLPEAVHQLIIHGVRPATRAALIGRNELRDRVRRELDASAVDIVADLENKNEVVKVLGRERVTGLEVCERNGRTRRLSCEVVVHLGPLVPAINLAQQAGCDTEYIGGHVCVRTDLEGKTSVSGVFSCGGVTGLSVESERIADGLAAGNAIAKHLGAA